MSAIKRQPLLSRYTWAKLTTALGAALSKDGPSTSGAAATNLSAGFLSKFKEVYGRNFTREMYLRGGAMAPALNKLGDKDASAVERLIVRLIPRGSMGSQLSIGDVIAFKSPAAANDYLVRRVAALEDTELVSDVAGDEVLKIPAGHCWVIADNEKLKAAEAQDSRTFGFIPYDSVLGRIIYRISLQDPKEHGPVANSPRSELADRAIIDAEVLPGLEGAAGAGQSA